MSAASSPNDVGDQTGAINKLTHLHFVIDEKRKAFKNWNRTVYKLTKFSLIALIALGVIYL
jgi:beta-hydroxylase